MQKHKRKVVKLANICRNEDWTLTQCQTPTFTNMLTVDKPTAMEQLSISYRCKTEIQDIISLARYRHPLAPWKVLVCQLSTCL